jgi:hypothetical protein
MTDRDRLLACRTEEEWQWWIEGALLGEIDWHSCLFCKIFRNSSFENPCNADHAVCNCLYLNPKSLRLFAGWHRLHRAGIV